MVRLPELLVAYVIVRLTDSTRSERTASIDAKKRFEIATVVAEQIWREQQITSYRMTWNLSFQGFLFAAFSLAFVTTSSVPSLVRLGAQLIIAAGGASVARATRHSILASQYQRDYMKSIWSELYPRSSTDSYPRPFSINSEAALGRRAATTILSSVLWMWVGFAIVAIALAVFENWAFVEKLYMTLSRL